MFDLYSTKLFKNLLYLKLSLKQVYYMNPLNVFQRSTTLYTRDRLQNLSKDTIPQWGKMDAGQMLAHLNVAYDVAFGKLEVKNNVIMKWFLKTFVKEGVVGEKPYPKNSMTAPYFMQKEPRDFELEKQKFIDNVQTVEQKGEPFFEGKESVSFGKMTALEWSNQFYKHLDHHFIQFGI